MVNGNVLTVTDYENRVTRYTYDKNGRLIKTERPDGSVESRSYDKAGQLLTIKDVTKSGSIINDYTYTYDRSGNITSVSDKSVGTKVQQSSEEDSVQMEYDNVNRLIKYNGKEVKYDADGHSFEMRRGRFEIALLFTKIQKVKYKLVIYD